MISPYDPERSQTTVQKWLGRIDHARKARLHRENDWDENRNMMNALSYMDRPYRYDRVWVNHMLSLVRIVVPLLYYKNPQFTALPLRDEDESRYRVAEAAINHWARVSGLKPSAKESIRDALVCSFGVMKVGWVIEETELKLKVNADGTRTIADDTTTEPQSAVKTEVTRAGVGSRPFTVRVSPWNFVRSRGSTSIRNASWVAERIFRRLEEVRRDPLFSGTRDLQPNATPGRGTPELGGSGIISTDHSNGNDTLEARALADPNDQLVELWEIWDLSDPAKPRQLVLAEGHQEPLLDRDWPYDLAGRFPYVEFQFIDVPDEPYPITFLSSIKELVREINIISSYELDFVKRATPKVAYDKNIIDQEEDLQALRSGDPIPAVGVNGNPNDAFANFGGATLNPDLKWVHSKVEENLNVISGVADFMRGGSADPKQLATVANIQVQALSMVTQDMVDRVADAMIQWAELVDMLQKEFADKPTMIRISGQTGFEWKTFTKDDLAGSFEYQIVPGSNQPTNKEVEIKQRLDFFNLLAPFIQPGSIPINGTELVKSIAELMPIKHLDKILGGKPDIEPSDPAEENYLLQQGGLVQVSERENFDEHLQTHFAFLQQEMSKPPESQDRSLVDRIQRHCSETMQTKQTVMMQQIMAQQMAMGGGAPVASGVPGQSVQTGAPSPSAGPPRSAGNGGPAANGPIRPRLMSEQQPTTHGILSATNRRNPPFPGAPGAPS